MTYEATHAGSTTSASGWVFPALAGGILTLLWGAYTLLVLVEIFTLPMPTYPG